MKRIAILGGTFNPIHNGHITMANAALKTGLYDNILIMPSGDPPHKQENSIVSKEHRLQMCSLAAQGNPGIEVSDFELKRDGFTYTLDTIKALITANPEHQYEMIIGADSLLMITRWYRFEELLKLCPFVVLNRPGFNQELLLKTQAELGNLHHANIRLIEMQEHDISSSEIRSRLNEGRPVQGMLPNQVLHYIDSHRLYIDEPIISYMSRLKKTLSQKRMDHSVSVMRTAVEMAIIFGVDPYKARIAGLLHDCAKGYSIEDKLKLSIDFKLPISEVERAHPDLLHAKLGAEIAKTEYGIEDIEILQSIACHTTGKPGMTTLEKIIFIADYIEPLRNNAPNLTTVRNLAKTSLDKTLIQVIQDTLDYLERKSIQIDPATIETLYYYLEKM